MATSSSYAFTTLTHEAATRVLKRKPRAVATAKESARMASLDAFRGFTIASMVLVNNPGDWGHLHTQLAHAKWNGWTFTDWVFPFFLFIGGVSSTLSLGRRAEAGADKPALLFALAKRAAIIFALGFALNLIPLFDFAHVRVLGVLQRIAICTVLAAPIVVYVRKWQSQLAIALLLFAAYIGLMMFVPVPDADGHVAAGVLEPGRDFGAFIDRKVLGAHLWVGSKTWDPEGLVSTLPALGSQLLGVLAGRWVLSSSRTPKMKLFGMIVVGLAFVVVGQVLHATHVMPINKSLWTPSYSIAMTGWALLVFSAFYWLMDVNGLVRSAARRAFLPFNIYGMNALFIFAFSGLVAKMMNFIKLTGPDGQLRSLKAIAYAPIKALPLSSVNTSLLFAIAFNAVMFFLAWAMWKKKWFVKV